MWFKYPYTNYSELNLDWFLQQFKELKDEWDTTSGEWDQMQLDFQTLEGTVQTFTTFVTNYFDNLDVQQEVNNKLNAMAEDGTLSTLLAPLVNTAVSEDIGDAVAAQISSTVASQIDDVVADQIVPVVAETVKPSYGSPLVASTVAEMTDQHRVYVYTGSEAGYTYGNWYYWNGSAWTSGGVYNASANFLQVLGSSTGDGMSQDAITKLTLNEKGILRTADLDSTTSDLNNIRGNGAYTYIVSSAGDVSNLPYSETIFSLISLSGSRGAGEIQLFIGASAGKQQLWYRRNWSDGGNIVWTSWHKIADDSQLADFMTEINKIVAYSDLLTTIDETTFPTQGYINSSGTLVPSSVNSYYSDRKRLISNKVKYRLYQTTGGAIGLIVFYDVEGNILEVVINAPAQNGFVEDEATAPAGAYYYRANNWGDDGYAYCGCVIETENYVPYLSAPAYLYGDSINKPIDFQGKNLVAFGDSITYGVANEGSGNIYAGSDAYISQFATHAQSVLTNKAVSGACITYASGESIQSIYSQVTSFTGSADVIIIAGGVNDYVTGKALGSFGDITNTNFYGALHGICEYLKSYFASADVIFITPANVTKEFGGRNISILNKYRNAIYQVATSYGYNVVNGEDMIPATKQTGWDDTMINHNDGCHPTIAGHKFYARNLAGKLL